jgi:mercuric ion transport protein
MKAEKLGVLSAILASTCCTVPLLLVLIGLGGAGLGSFFSEHHWWFQGIAAVLLGAAWWFFLREKRRLEGLNSEVKNERFTGSVLALATVVLVVFVGQSVRNAPVAAMTGKAPISASVAQNNPDTEGTLATITLPVKGMTCFTCEIHVRSVLKKVDGVREIKVSAARQSATVTYDPRKVTPEQLAKIINTETPYRASVPASPTRM